MANSRWDAFRNGWRGFCGGVLAGLAIGVWIADKPGLKFFVGGVSAGLLFLAGIPDLLTAIARGVQRYRAAARDTNVHYQQRPCFRGWFRYSYQIQASHQRTVP